MGNVIIINSLPEIAKVTIQRVYSRKPDEITLNPSETKIVSLTVGDNVNLNLPSNAIFQPGFISGIPSTKTAYFQYITDSEGSLTIVYDPSMYIPAPTTPPPFKPTEDISSDKGSLIE